MTISEIITDKYKLRIPPTVYYDLLADVVEAEGKQELILNKIRAEIKAMSGDIETIADVLQIIDKYKAESEVKANENEK